MQTPGSGYQLHRVVFTADVPANLTDRDAGMNMAGYRFAHIQVVPIDTRTPPKKMEDWPGANVGIGAGADPSVKVYTWCQALGRFILFSTYVGAAGVPAEFDVEAGERIIFIALTTSSPADQAVAIFIDGQFSIEL